MAKKSNILREGKKLKFQVRYRNRCQLCGRPRGYIRDFGLCRICFRLHAQKGELPGVTKVSL